MGLARAGCVCVGTPNCPGAHMLETFAGNTLEPGERPAVEAHLEVLGVGLLLACASARSRGTEHETRAITHAAPVALPPPAATQERPVSASDEQSTRTATAATQVQPVRAAAGSGAHPGLSRPASPQSQR